MIPVPKSAGRAYGHRRRSPERTAMRPTPLLRTASVLSLVHCILHTVGGVLAPPRHGAEEIAVLETMRSHRFDVMGSMRSYGDFLLGYGLFVTLALLADAVLFWQLAAFARTSPAWLRPIVAVFFFNFVAMAIVSWRYFFIAPVVTELIIAACLGAAFASLRKAG
jgi:hypothetical protein